MKKLTCSRDYLCIAGKPSDITVNLNKIARLYDFKVLSSAFDDGVVMVIIERRERCNGAGAEEA